MDGGVSVGSAPVSASPAIEVAGLGKRYGAVRALEGLSLTVEPGEVFGLLGPNGAGKTTTVEILEGYRRADAGEVRVLGLDPWHDGPRLRPKIGVMLQDGGLYPGIRPLEALALFAVVLRRARRPRAAARRRRAARSRAHARAAHVRWAAPAALARAGADRAAVAGVPRRADRGHGPARARDDLGPGPRAARPRRDRRAHHARDGRGRAAVRPARHHRPRPHGRVRHAGGADRERGRRRDALLGRARASIAPSSPPRSAWTPGAVREPRPGEYVVDAAATPALVADARRLAARPRRASSASCAPGAARSKRCSSASPSEDRP